MPTTMTPVDTGANVWFIQARTTSGNVDVDDAAGEDFRVPAAQYAAGGGVTPNAFKSTLTTGMSFTVGSGTAKKDVVVVPGTASGSPYPYLVALQPATVAVTLAASSASGLRRDELYVVVYDKAYPTAAVALPRLIVRQGDLGGAAPGPDAAWRAYQVVGQYFVGQNATAPVIEQGAAGATPARLQTQIMALHAAQHAIGGVDSLGVQFPRNDEVSINTIPDFVPPTANVMEASATRTVTLPTAMQGQNIKVTGLATCTFDQNVGVGNSTGQQVRFQLVIAGDTGADMQRTSTANPGGTEVNLSAEHTKDIDGVSSFTVGVRGQGGYPAPGTFTQINVQLSITCPRPVGSNAYTVA